MLRRMRRHLPVLPVLAAILAISGCGGDDSLESRDPNGFQACGVAAVPDEDPLATSVAAGRLAAKATTDSIAATAGEPVDVSDAVPGAEPLIIANMDELMAACDAEGFDPG